MKQVSVRELRQNASVWLRAVEAGESFEITNHGRPVALLGPVPVGSVLERLIAEGRVVPAKGDLLSHGRPLPPRPGVDLPSRILERMRADER
jgi:prevent-host-death family protein